MVLEIYLAVCNLSIVHVHPPQVRSSFFARTTREGTVRGLDDALFQHLALILSMAFLCAWDIYIPQVNWFRVRKKGVDDLAFFGRNLLGSQRTSLNPLSKGRIFEV